MSQQSPGARLGFDRAKAMIAGSGGQIGNGPVAGEVVVETPAQELASLILAVHEYACSRRAATNRFVYGNVVELTGSNVRDLPPREAARRYRTASRPVAAITVTQRHVGIDVLFGVEGGRALARFHANARCVDGLADSESASFASYLARGTVAVLARCRS